MQFKTISILSTLILSGALAANFANAREDDQRAVAALSQARITLEQAVQSALQAHPGQALEAEIEHEHGRTLYVVEVATQDKILEVGVDPITGQVVGVEDEGNHEADENEDEE